MKHFLLSIIFVSAGVFVSANPFDLKENLQKIDQDQDILLSALKEMADKKGREVALGTPEVSDSEPSTVQNKIEENIAEPHEVEKISKKSTAQTLPEELQKFKDIIEAKIEKKGKPLEGKVKDIFQGLLKEKNNPNFSLDDAKKIIEGNKDVGMAMMAYMMGKSLAQYNQLNPKEKEEFDKKAIEKIENGSNNKDKLDAYAKKYPEEVREIAFSFLEDILANGVPQVDLNMEMSGAVSSNPAESKPFTVKVDMQAESMDKKREKERLEVEAYEAKRRAKKEQDEARTKVRMAEKKAKEVKAAKLKAKHAIVDIDIEREERMSKKEADKEYLEAIREMH